MTDNPDIIFFDTEFTDLNARTGELLSIGMLCESRGELYLELEYSDEPHPWVVKNVLPSLSGDQVSADVAREKILEYIGDPEQKPYLMAYVNQFDAIFWYDLFGSPKETNPVYWIPIDFASILFAHGYDPNSMAIHAFFDELNIDKSSYTGHNALDDAKLLRDTYVAFTKLIGQA